MPRLCRQVWVTGRVQGVAFRWYTQQRAAELGVDGWVRNLADGRVEAWLEGDAEPVSALLGWLRRGPPHASVSGLDVRERVPEGLAGFEIRRGGP